jgi:hypothetical protein
MSSVCSICSHVNRLGIDREIVQGVAIAQLAKKYSLPYWSLYTHARSHVSRQIQQAYEKKNIDAGIDLLTKIDTIIARAEAIFQRNFDRGRDGTALKAIDSQRSTIELLAKISYNLHQAQEAEHQRELEGTANDPAMQKKLKVLTTAELIMLNRLQQKVIDQTHEVIIPDEVTSVTEVTAHKMTRRSWPAGTVTPQNNSSA